MKKIRILLLDLGDVRGELNEPLGIECISTSLNKSRSNYVDVKWFNMSYNLETTNYNDYDIIGISMNIGVLNRFNQLMNLLNVNYLNKPIVVGGTIATFGYSELLQLHPNIICIRGEGEDAFFALTELLNYNNYIDMSELNDIPNLAYFFNDQIITTQMRPVDINNIGNIIRDSYIMDFLREKKGIVRIEGSRGCSWNKCSFCCIKSKYADSNWNPYSVDKIVNELILLSNLGFKSPYFTDEDFLGHDYERAKLLSEQIKKNKRLGRINEEMNFFISILASDLSCEHGRSAIISLKEAGLREVFVGVESMSTNQIERYKKKSSIDVNLRAIEFIKSVGLQLDTGYILFDPVMSFEELKENISYIEMLEMHKLDGNSLKKMRLQPLTEITGSLRKLREEEIDLNNLEYHYLFSDNNVQSVYSKYSEWENICKQDVWEIQSMTRGEVNEDYRIRVKKMLSEIREIDFLVLKHITSNVVGDINYDCLNTKLEESILLKKNIICKIRKIRNLS